MTSLLSKIHFRLVRSFTRNTFGLWQKLGFHIVPNHFYHPIPDTSKLPPELFTTETKMIGSSINDAGQVALLETFATEFRAEYEALPRDPTGVPYEFHMNNEMFASVDAEIYYCMIRHYKPKRIMEIGSGYSTRLSSKAALKNISEGHPCELIAIEPYPKDYLKAGFPGLARLIELPVQKVPLAEFEQLGENDILFIDSSHVLKTGSDVWYEFLEVLPRMAKGVITHVHDICLPADYPYQLVMKDRMFFTEQYILQAFLAHNDSYEVMFGRHYMHMHHPDLLKAAFSSYKQNKNDWGGSFWIRRIK